MTTYTRLGILRAETDPNLTYEGENWVLIQQTSKVLVDFIQSGKEKSPLGTLNFLRKFNFEAESFPNALSGKIVEFSDPLVLLELLEFRSSYYIFTSGEKLKKEILSGKQNFDAWNESQVEKKIFFFFFYNFFFSFRFIIYIWQQNLILKLL